MGSIENASELLKKNNQFKVLRILEQAGEKQEELANQLLKIDFNFVNQLYKSRNAKLNLENNVEPIHCISKEKLNGIEKKNMDSLGEEIIKKDEYAVVTMAGGQGTRLGWKGPKGTFKLNIGKNEKYIFEILADTLSKSRDKYGLVPYWYIMTSIENNDETVQFFQEHNFLGYDKEKVKFFKQSVLPLMDKEGNLLIDKELHLKEASDGNGGVYRALVKSGMVDDMKLHSIKWVYICGVDNIMANMIDETLLGLAIRNNVPSASKSIKKAYPEEKLGCFCKKNGKPAVIEYIDMDENMIYSRNTDGELIYGESNFVAHLFKTEAIEEIAKHNLMYHCAIKKNSYLDENLKEIMPDEPNTYKYEAFIFDGFQFLDDMAILSVNRNEEFAPIKNATGIDSPETAKEIYENANR